MSGLRGFSVRRQHGGCHRLKNQRFFNREFVLRPNIADYGKGMVINMEKKKQKTAIALEYNPEEEAPKIIATGKGRVAEKIIEAAQEADVPIHEDSKLADTLSKLEIGEMIPPELYEVVAEILVFVDAMDKIKEKMEKRGIL